MPKKTIQKPFSSKTRLPRYDGEWKITTLGEIGDIRNGATPNTQVPANWNGTIPWCTPTDITNTPGKYLHQTDRNITSEGLANCAANLLPVGALLLCSRATIGEIKIAAIPMCTNQGFKSIICKNDVFNEFLYYLFLTLKQQMVERATGSTFLEISKQDVKSIKINLPTVDEQISIAKALSDVDGLLDSLDVLITKKAAIKKAAMQKLLTGRSRLPNFNDEWKSATLPDVAVVRKGQLMTFSNLIPGHIPVIAGGKTPAYFHAEANRMNPCVTVSASGANAGYVAFHKEPIYASDCSTVEASNTITVEFVYYWLSANQDLVYSLQAGGAQPHVQPKDLYRLKIDYPKLSEQIAITTILSSMDAEITALECRREKIWAIKRGMMQQLLTGKIRLVETDAKS